MALRAAVFDLDGVLALPSIAGALSRAEEALALPRGFLNDAFLKEGMSGSSARLMRGEITFSQTNQKDKIHLKGHSGLVCSLAEPIRGTFPSLS